MYRAMGFAHATIARHLEDLQDRLHHDDGQGTVEYIGLVLLLAAVMAVVATKSGNGGAIGEKIVSAVNEALDTVGAKGGKG